MKTLKQFLFGINAKQKDDPIFNYQTRLNSLKSFQPAPSFWALIPVRIENIRYPQKQQQEPDSFD